MRDCHDKKLRVFIVLVRLFFTIFAVVLTFSPFSVKMAVFCISEKHSFDNRNFENIKFSNIPTLLCSNFQPLRPVLLFFCCVGRLLCQSGRMAHTPRTVPINVPIDRITPGYCQVVFQFSLNNLTNRIRKFFSDPPQLTTCHKWHHTTSHCLSNIFTKFAP